MLFIVEYYSRNIIERYRRPYLLGVPRIADDKVFAILAPFNTYDREQLIFDLHPCLIINAVHLERHFGPLVSRPASLGLKCCPAKYPILKDYQL